MDKEGEALNLLAVGPHSLAVHRAGSCAGPWGPGDGSDQSPALKSSVWGRRELWLGSRERWASRIPPHTVFQVATRLPYPLCVSRTSSGSPLHAQLLCVTQQDPLDPQPLVQPLTSVPPHSWAPPTHFTLLSKAQHGNWLPQLWMSLLLLCLLSPFPFPSPSLSTASSHHQPSCSQQNTLMARIFV